MKHSSHTVSALYGAHEEELDGFVDTILSTFIVEEGDLESRELHATILVFDRIHDATNVTVTHVDLENGGACLASAINEALAMHDVDGAYTLAVVVEDRTQGAVGPVGETIELGTLNENLDDEIDCDPDPHPQY